MCNVNYSYDDLVDEFEALGEPNEVWYVLCNDEVVAEMDCRDGAVDWVKEAISEDLFYHGHAQKYKIEQAEF